jgi:hypothetical protein
MEPNLYAITAIKTALSSVNIKTRRNVEFDECVPPFRKNTMPEIRQKGENTEATINRRPASETPIKFNNR